MRLNGIYARQHLAIFGQAESEASTMIDATFYEDGSVPPEWKMMFPDWLIALGFKVQNDLLGEIRQAGTEAAVVEKVKAYIANRGLRLVEPIQVSVAQGHRFIYHDVTLAARLDPSPDPMPPVVSPPNYTFMYPLRTNQARLVAWEDNSANNIDAVGRFHRHNLGLVSRIRHLDILLIVELHWGTSLTRFEYQVAHLRPLIRPVQIEIINLSAPLLEKLLRDPNELYRIGAERFEDLILNRLEAMGFNVQRVSK